MGTPLKQGAIMSFGCGSENRLDTNMTGSDRRQPKEITQVAGQLYAVEGILDVHTSKEDGRVTIDLKASKGLT
jgi:hypothetical protein